jgi:phage-related protein
VDGGIFEIAVKHRGDAFRAIYAVQIGDDVWVIDAFQKKSKSGIKTRGWTWTASRNELND